MPFLLLQDDTCLGTRLEAGKYILLPFTSGCRVQTNTAVDFSSKRTRLVSEKKEPSDQVELTTEYQTALKEIFDLVDLDNNGRLSRQEFTLFQWRACREEVQDDEWAALEGMSTASLSHLSMKNILRHLWKRCPNFISPEPKCLEGCSWWPHNSFLFEVLVPFQSLINPAYQ